MKSQIKKLTKEILKDTIAIRRYFHSNPELSGCEFQTLRFIEEKLHEFGIDKIEKYAETGLVATISGNKKSGKLVALRADMDALPIHEMTELSYSSKNEGVMHACGHDVHTANLLASAWILNQIKDQFEGSVQLIFQPSEEKIPSGAERMLKEGIFKNDKPDIIIAMHVDPNIPTGKLGYRCGNMSASADECYISIKGKGGHAAYPNQFINPIIIASELLIDLVKLNEPTTPIVVTFGKFEALGKTNVVPETANLEGTIRTFDENRRKEIHHYIREKSKELEKKYSCNISVNIPQGYPVLKTDTALTLRCKENLKDFFGEDCMIESPLRMGADDFSYFSEQIPATLLRLGTQNEKKGVISSLHTNTFTIDEDIIEIGIETLCWLTICELNRKDQND